MKFLVDAQLPYGLALFLRDKGCDALHTNDFLVVVHDRLTVKSYFEQIIESCPDTPLNLGNFFARNDITVRTTDTDFFSVIREKLLWGTDLRNTVIQ